MLLYAVCCNCGKRYLMCDNPYWAFVCECGNVTYRTEEF